MFHANDRNAPHWSKDYVEHIRTVHFALVAVCLGLIGLVQFEKPKDVTTARSQFEKIRNLVDHWNSVWTAYNKLFSENHVATFAVKELSVKTQDEEYIFGWAPDLRRPTETDPLGVAMPFSPPSSNTTLGEFKSYWNDLTNTPFFMATRQ